MRRWRFDTYYGNGSILRRLDGIIMSLANCKKDEAFMKRYEKELAELPEQTIKEYEEWLRKQVPQHFIDIFEEEMK